MRRTAVFDHFIRACWGAALVMGLLSIPVTLPGQVATTMYGTLSNFDVVNNTGGPTEGFEIQIEGVTPQDITYTFGASYIRYGNPTVVPYPGGVYVRYMSPWDPAAQRFTTATPPAVNFPPTLGHLCYTGALGSAYPTSGCEHFGVGLARTATNTTYRWMVPDAATPGALTALNPPVAIPAPIWSIIPPALPGNPPVVVAEVVAPELPVVAQFGDAQWMKVYKTELPRHAILDELLSDNPAVPQDPALLETAWTLMQAQVGANGKRNRNRNQGGLANSSQSVVRRYEFYVYKGTYDPLTHEALCADPTCNVPAGGEVGDYIGAQMAAANLKVPDQATLNVATAGSGTVTGTVGGVKCPGVCAATVAAGTGITLTAAPPSGTAFVGWSGGLCSGNSVSCFFTLNASATVTATFSPLFTLSVGRGGKGTVTSNPAGINCGGTCSSKFTQGTSIALSATPAPGGVFVNWTGGCTGTSPTCTVAIGKSTSVQANFK